MIAEEKDVDVEEARAFGESFSAAKLGLDGAEGMQELDGLRIGFTFDDAIEEPGLVEVIDRLGFVEGRNSTHTIAYIRAERKINAQGRLGLSGTTNPLPGNAPTPSPSAGGL